MADINDIEHLWRAIFLSDGRTVVMRDGTIAHCRVRVRNPWVEVRREA